MEKIGFSIRFYPTDVIDEVANLAIERIVWDGRKVARTEQTAVIPMKGDLQALAQIHEPAWIISILELAGHAITDAILAGGGGWVSGTCASPIRASETPSHDM